MSAPHMMVGDLECKKLTVQDSYTYTGNHTVTGNQTVSGTNAVTGASTLTGALAANGGVTTTTITATGAVSFGVGQRQRVFQEPRFKDDSGSKGTTPTTRSFFLIPTERAKLAKFGIMSTGSKVVCSTTTQFELRTKAGVFVASYRPGDTSISSGVASGHAPNTATYLKSNVQYVGRVNTDVASSGSVYYFIDIQPVGT